MSPPPVKPPINPNNHKIKNIINMVQSMYDSFLTTESVCLFQSILGIFCKYFVKKG